MRRFNIPQQIQSLKNFDKEGFLNAVNQMRQLPENERLAFVQNYYKSAQNGYFTENKQRFSNMIQSNDPSLPQVANIMTNQIGLTY